MALLRVWVGLLVGVVAVLCGWTAGTAAAGTPTSTTTSTTSTTPLVTQLMPAPGHGDPTSLTGNVPVPAVTSAVAAVTSSAPLPAPIVPDQTTLAAENAATITEVPLNCLPPFGVGIENTTMCAVTGSFSDPVVVVMGDSHAGNWIPAIEPLAQRLGLAVVPMDKPGCFVNRLHENLAGWPCGKWYQWALKEDHLLNPVATVVAFRMDLYGGARLKAAVSDLSSMLKQVKSPVYIADPPPTPQTWPGQCISQPEATMGSCTSRPWVDYGQLMEQTSAALAKDGVPALPTAQWFCADGTCPMVIDGTLVDRDSDPDGGHMTIAYAQALSTVLGDELGPVLRRLEARRR